MVYLEKYRRYVTRDGLVYRRGAKNELRLCSKSLLRGYEYVPVYRPTAGRSCMQVHRLVAIAFLPNPEGFAEVDHIDRNKANNNVSNLRWCSRQTNNLNKPCVDNLRKLGLKSNTPEYQHYWYMQHREQHNAQCMARYHAKRRAA